MAEKLDPQVQIRLIDLAWDIAKIVTPISKPSRDDIVKEKAERFDQAYKAVIKTLGYE